MAKLKYGIQFTGSVANLTAYTMRGTEGIVLRSKGGASRQQIRTSPAFEQVRRNNVEFSGRAVASKWIMKALWPQKALADYNTAGPLNALLKPIQELDLHSAWGQRHVQLSKAPALLAGFSLNRKNVFDSIVRTPLFFEIDTSRSVARIEVPPLLKGINFFPPGNHQLYSIVGVLGVVPDLFFNHGRYEPSSELYAESRFVVAETQWSSVFENTTSQTVDLVSAFRPPDTHATLLLSVGIRYGALMNNGFVQQVAYAGSAKVLAAVAMDYK